MRWLVANWRLKLLAIVLALALLMAVAFSENPPTASTVKVGVTYSNVPQNLVVMNPPTSVPVNVVGLSDNVKRFSQTSVGAVIDLAGAHQGANQTFQAHVNTDPDGVSIQQTQIPLRLDVEPLATKQLPVEVRVTNVSNGVSVVPDGTYATCGNDAQSCQVTVTAPQPLLDGLHAVVKFDFPLQSAGIQRAPSLPVQFERNGQALSLASTQVFPGKIAYTPGVVTARVATQGGVLSKTVGITVAASGQPACGYQIDGVAVAPSAFATISGPAPSVAKFSSLNLGSVSINGATSSQTFTKQLLAASDVQVVDPKAGAVTVSVSISRAFTCGAATSPGPGAGAGGTPGATPSPESPTPAPTASPSR
jgi:YbbR domain-containing protein